MYQKKTLENAEHYIWGDACHGWHLLKSNTLSVIQEKMPPGAAEVLHFHAHAQQLFYILLGKATFFIDQKIVEVEAGESMHILPGVKHQIKNLTSLDLHFLVISQPKSHGDRIIVGEE